MKVGIIDLGFIGYTAAQASGDLPPSLTTADFGCGGVATTDVHGTAVAEIVHKMAPAAELYLICIATDVNLGQAKDYAVAQGIKIVNHSVGWFNSSRGDGSGGPGSPDAIASSARASGILWVNAAGNEAQHHWSGCVRRRQRQSLPRLRARRRTQYVHRRKWRNGVRVALKWDSWPATAQDFDLYLYRVSPLTEVQASVNPQTGSQPPTEQLCFLNSGATQPFGLAIFRFSATATPGFNLFVSTNE